MLTVMMACLIGWVLFLRGGQFHNWLVLEAEKICRKAGLETEAESPQRLPDGRIDFVDLLVRGDKVVVCIEVETSARNVLSNARKAERLGLPLIVLVPTRRVHQAAQRKLAGVDLRPGGWAICFLLLTQLKPSLSFYFPLISPANRPRENKKLNPGGQS